jgi:hypothetical protein
MVLLLFLSSAAPASASAGRACITLTLTSRTSITATVTPRTSITLTLTECA